MRFVHNDTFEPKRLEEFSVSATKNRARGWYNPHSTRTLFNSFRPDGWILYLVLVHPVLTGPHSGGHIQQLQELILPLPDKCFRYEHENGLVTGQGHQLSSHRKLDGFP